MTDTLSLVRYAKIQGKSWRRAPAIITIKEETTQGH
jgi:hypothetical protein